MRFPRCGFLDVVSQLPPMFLHSLSSCLPLVSQMSPPTCLEGVVSQMFSPSPLVVLLSSSSLPAVVSRLSSGCLPGVVSHPFCCLVVFHLSHRCGLKIVLQWSLRPCTISICFSELVFQVSPHVFNCSPVVSQLSFSDVVSHLPPNCLVLVLQV